MIIETNPPEDVKISQDSKQNAGIIQFKIVYWGPGESGKTTNFMELRKRFHAYKLTRGFSVETTDGRTLWQDSLYLSFDFELGVQIFNIVAQIVTCTGQERFLATREYVLDGADGAIFVGDSDSERMESNKRSFRELISFVAKSKIPYLIQLNKRDLDNAVPMEEFKKQLNLPKEQNYPDGTHVVYPAIANEGRNVISCFQDLILQVIFNYFSGGD